MQFKSKKYKIKSQLTDFSAREKKNKQTKHRTELKLLHQNKIDKISRMKFSAPNLRIKQQSKSKTTTTIKSAHIRARIHNF